MKIIIQAVGIFLVSLFYFGCSLQSSVPPTSKYLLSVDLSEKNVADSCFGDKVVRIGEIESSDIMAGRAIVYRTDASQSYTYQRARWMESVNKQLSRLMMNSLTNSRIFKDVIPFRSLAKNDLILETGIYDFSQTIHDDGTSNVHLAVKVRLVEQYTRKIVTTKFFEYSKSGLEGNIDGALKGYDILVDKFLEEVNKWLEKSCSTTAAGKK